VTDDLRKDLKKWGFVSVGYCQISGTILYRVISINPIYRGERLGKEHNYKWVIHFGQEREYLVLCGWYSEPIFCLNIQIMKLLFCITLH
jgi:hypothetical protein